MANNDVVYLWWSIDQKISDCLGFTIRRVTPNGKESPLPAWVGFEKTKKAVRPKTTDQWPVQGFQWKDVTGPREVNLRYRIIPLGGTPARPIPLPGPIIETPTVRMTRQYGPIGVTFNRGLIATQALNRSLRRQDMSGEDLRKCIGIPSNEFRVRLARDMVDAVTSLLRRARSEGGRCFCALYELSDEELITELEKTRGTEIILSNADSSANDKKVYDGTNQPARKRLSASGNVEIYDRFLNNKKIGSRIGHNKFVVYLDRQGRPLSVVTGSTNWTPTGLCSQTNNSIRIDVAAVANRFLDYWKKLLEDTQDDDSSQGADLRTWAGKDMPADNLGFKSGTAKVWFSPNTKKRTKGEETPLDIKELYRVIESAQKGIFFLLFNPGSPSIVEKIKDVASERSKNRRFLFIRGAISDAPSAGKAAIRIYSRSAAKAPDVLITGVGGIPDDFGYWTKELYKLGHAVIHDKLIVIDPFSKNSVVITGSHNLGYKASYMNDENMVIIRANPKVAEAYATHILDVVNHFRWRYKLQGLQKDGRLEDAWNDLAEDDSWQDVYFAKNLLKSRDAFFLSQND